MRRTATLIILLFLALASTAYAKTRHHVHRGRISEQPGSPVIILNTDSLSADTLISFAKTLLNTPYRAASSNPLYGFDCSGFVSYVFKSFNVNVPRSSCEFENVGKPVELADAKPGDVILFTGTRSHHPHSIGHVGIIYSNDGSEIRFIHSTSGKEYCVTVSAMDDTYKRRFVKVVRILAQNNDAMLASR